MKNNKGGFTPEEIQQGLYEGLKHVPELEFVIKEIRAGRVLLSGQIWDKDFDLY